MIELTRLNGNPLVVNSDLIKWAEAAPDTMLTLINGEKVVVLESCAEVVERITAQRARLLTEVVRLAPGVTPAEISELAASAAGASGVAAVAGHRGLLSQAGETDFEMDPSQRRRRQEL